MRKMFLSLAVLALVASPAFAGKFNKVVSVGDKAPTFAGIPAVIGRPGHQSQPQRHQGRRGRPGLPGQPLPRGHGVRGPDHRLHQRLQGQGRQGRRRLRSTTWNRTASRGIKDYIKDKGSTYVYGYDESQEIGKAYGATNTPQFFVLDKDRTIRYTGALDDNQNESKVSKTYLRNAVDAVLKGESPRSARPSRKGCGISYSNEVRGAESLSPLAVPTRHGGES